MDMTYSVGSRILKTFQQFLQYYEASSLAQMMFSMIWIQMINESKAKDINIYNHRTNTEVNAFHPYR